MFFCSNVQDSDGHASSLLLLHVCIPIPWHADALTLCSYHLTHSNDIGQRKKHCQLTIVFHQSSISRFGKSKLALYDLKWMLNLGSNTGFHIFDIDWDFVDSRMLLESPDFPMPFSNLPINGFASKALPLIDSSIACISKTIRAKNFYFRV